MTGQADEVQWAFIKDVVAKAGLATRGAIATSILLNQEITIEIPRPSGDGDSTQSITYESRFWAFRDYEVFLEPPIFGPNEVLTVTVSNSRDDWKWRLVSPQRSDSSYWYEELSMKNSLSMFPHGGQMRGLRAFQLKGLHEGDDFRLKIKKKGSIPFFRHANLFGMTFPFWIPYDTCKIWMKTAFDIFEQRNLPLITLQSDTGGPMFVPVVWQRKRDRMADEYQFTLKGVRSNTDSKYRNEDFNNLVESMTSDPPWMAWIAFEVQPDNEGLVCADSPFFDQIAERIGEENVQRVIRRNKFQKKDEIKRVLAERSCDRITIAKLVGISEAHAGKLLAELERDKSVKREVIGQKHIWSLALEP